MPDVPTILNSIPHNHTCFTVVDLCSAFFSIPIHADTQPLFAFTFKGVQLTWTCLAQEFVDSPAVFSAAVKRVLNTVTNLPSTGLRCLIQHGIGPRNSLNWTSEAEEHFEALKIAITCAPALGLPDYSRPFHLHAGERLWVLQ